MTAGTLTVDMTAGTLTVDMAAGTPTVDMTAGRLTVDNYPLRWTDYIISLTCPFMANVRKKWFMYNLIQENTPAKHQKKCNFQLEQLGLSLIHI